MKPQNLNQSISYNSVEQYYMSVMNIKEFMAVSIRASLPMRWTPKILQGNIEIKLHYMISIKRQILHNLHHFLDNHHTFHQSSHPKSLLHSIYMVLLLVSLFLLV